jgi:hypothetical protein
MTKKNWTKEDLPYTVRTEESSYDFQKFEDAVDKYEDCQDEGLENVAMIWNLPDFMIDITHIYKAGVDTGIFQYERIRGVCR